MKIRLLLPVALVISLAFPYTGIAFAAPTAQVNMDSGVPAVPGELVVGFDTAGRTDASAATSEMAASVARSLSDSFAGVQVAKAGDGVALLSLDANINLQAASAAISRQSGVTYVEPNYIYSIPEMPTRGSTESSIPTAPDLSNAPGRETTAGDASANLVVPVPNDPNAFSNWGWSWIGSDQIWPDLASSPTVCVLDTGVDASHPDLVGRVLNGADFVNDDLISNDDFGHGTHVTGVISAAINNLVGIAGVSRSMILAVKVLDSQGTGSNYDIAAGIRYCANYPGVKVLNMSLGGSAPSISQLNALTYAAVTKGQLVVVAAGNSGSATPQYPAGFSDPDLYPALNGKILSVAALATTSSCKASFSNYNASTGQNSNWVDIAAPGEGIYSTTPTGTFYMNTFEGVSKNYATLSGTSMATPHVAGAAARVWSINPVFTNTQVANALVNQSWDTLSSCWPNSGANRPPQVGVSRAMNRMAIYSARVLDADTTLGLSGASIAFYQQVGALFTLRGSMTTDASGYNTTALLNLPAGIYQVQVFRPGYTAASQPYAIVNLSQGGYWYGIQEAYLAPLSSNFDVIMNWTSQFTSGTDPDSLLFLPTSAGVSGSSLIAPYNRGSLSSAAIDGFVSPFARYLREGGFTGDGSPDLVPMERIRIKFNPSNPNAVYYSGDYYVVVTDFGDINLYGVGSAGVHIWKGGLLRTGIFNNCDPGGTAATPGYWVAAKINGATVTPMNGSNYPYTASGTNCFTSTGNLPPYY